MRIATFAAGAALALAPHPSASAQSYEDWTATDISQFWAPPETAPYRSHVETTPTGDAHLSVPLALPHARLVPELALQYSARGGDDPHLGTGWSLTVPTIERDTTLGPPTYVDDLFTGPDGRLVGGGTTWRAEVDRSGHRRAYVYKPSTNTWTVTGKSGLRDTYGAVRTGPDGTFAWALTQRENTFGDVISYEYADGLLDRVSYGGNDFTADEAEYDVVLAYVCARATDRRSWSSTPNA